VFLERDEQDVQLSESQDSQALPTMADLLALESELNTIDATLAELQD
jgi:hypothetical protein